MARSRRTPPLFEVMRETNRQPEEVRPLPGPVILPRRSEPAPREASPVLRVPTPPRDAEAKESGVSGMRGVMLSWPVLLGGIGVLVAVVAIVATIAFNAGAKRERNDILGPTTAPPDVAGGKPGELTRDPLASPEAPQPRAQEPAGGFDSAAQPVFGDDPREAGKNYLVVETLMFDDAMAAANFLTQNGVPSVVVAPEGVDPQKLAQQPRGLWRVIVREGFTRDEFRANSARADALRDSVRKLGRRWKQDHKGPSDFASCLWDKYGK